MNHQLTNWQTRTQKLRAVDRLEWIMAFEFWRSGPFLKFLYATTTPVHWPCRIFLRHAYIDFSYAKN